MSSATSDRNLLLGIVALQMDFVSRDALLAALSLWALQKSRSLADILVDCGHLSNQRRGKLEDLLNESFGPPVEPTVPPTSPAPPLVPSRYRVKQLHKEGGLGEVYIADDDELHRVVALKQIKPRYADDAECRTRFLIEAEVTGRLEHPGIVPVYGLGRHIDGRPYYAMRFIQGESLADAIRQFHKADDNPRRHASERAVAFRGLLTRFVSVCNAIAYAHSRGVIHRDLKPSNIMLGPFGETLVVDWGLAKVIDPTKSSSSGLAALTQQGVCLGTAAYMAPEQVKGLIDQIDYRTDIYLLGGILYEILTNQPPHGRGKRTVDPPQARAVKPGVAAALDDVLARAMSPEPGDRYAHATDIAHEVECWLAEEPVAAFRAVVVEFEELVREEPTSREHREQLAQTKVSLGLVFWGMGRHGESEQALQEAVREYQMLSASYPSEPRYRADLSATRMHLSRVLLAQGRRTEAEDLKRKATSEPPRSSLSRSGPATSLIDTPSPATPLSRASLDIPPIGRRSHSPQDEPEA